MRPAGPLPRTLPQVDAGSHARRRTAGEASGFSPRRRAAAPSGRARRLGAGAGFGDAGRGAGAGFALRCGAAGAGAGVAAAARPLGAAPARHFLQLPAPSTSSRISSAPTASMLPTSPPSATHLAGDRRRNLDRRLVGHHVGQHLVLVHRVADLDVPVDDSTSAMPSPISGSLMT